MPDLAGLFQRRDGVHIQHAANIVTVPALQCLLLRSGFHHAGSALVARQRGKRPPGCARKCDGMAFLALVERLYDMQLRSVQLAQLLGQCCERMWLNQRQIRWQDEPAIRLRGGAYRRCNAVAHAKMGAIFHMPWQPRGLYAGQRGLQYRLCPQHGLQFVCAAA